ncbi:hypothetical protein AB4140_00955 [Shewanella sp. 10N.286.51.B2]|uniref:hypothetical protein n=1 Tax=Shewanella sp. 10N.286.51.B2 TaxID=3229707 RepID=UPI0035539B96
MNDKDKKQPELATEIYFESSSINKQVKGIDKSAEKTPATNENNDALQAPNSVLLRALEYREATGTSSYLLDHRLEVQKPLYEDIKKGRRKRREKLLASPQSGTETRYYSRDLDAAFLAIQKLNTTIKGELQFVTVYFSRAVREKSLIAKDITKYLRKNNRWLMPTMVVLESGSVRQEQATHAHIITITTQSSDATIGRFKELLAPYKKSSTGIQSKGAYVVKYPYTELTQAEEDQFGEIPFEKNHEHPYWLNTWRELNAEFYNTEISVNGGAAHYLSKEINDEKRYAKRVAVTNLGDAQGFIKAESAAKSKAYQKKYLSTSKKCGKNSKS